MAEYIERSALMRRIETEAFRWGEEYDLQQILGDIEDAPAADVVEVRRGAWVLEHDTYGKMICSFCKEEALNNECNEYVDSLYCPNCGAKMDGKDGVE